MYAIVEIAGKQFRVSKDDTIKVPKITGDVGNSIELDKVLLLVDKGKISVGQPTVAGATVKAKILEFGRYRKVIVFKKKRRKGYQVKRGHRQDYAHLAIESIGTARKKAKGEDADGA